MDIQFIIKNNKIGIIFKNTIETSNILFLSKEDVTKMINQIETVLLEKNDGVSVFESKKFSFIRNEPFFILSIYITDSYAEGLFLSYANMKNILAQLNMLIRKII